MSYPDTKPWDLWHEAAKFSDEAFGPPSFRGPLGPLEHLKEEADEAAKNPQDIVEFADCLLLVFDAARRAGHDFHDLFRAALEKVEVNKNKRNWPDLRNSDPNVPLKHVK